MSGYDDARDLIQSGYSSLDHLVVIAGADPKLEQLVLPATAARDQITAAAKVLDQITPIPHLAGLASINMTTDAANSVGIRTVNLKWSDVQHTPGGDIIRPNNIDKAFTLGGPFRVRFFMGRYSPRFVFDTTRGGVTLYDPVDKVTAECIRWWDSRVQDLQYDVVERLAAEYDGEINTIFIGSPGTIYAEPLIRKTNHEPNRLALAAAGYTPELDKASYEAAFRMFAEFKRTNIAMSFNNWDYVKPDGTGGVDGTYPITLMDRMKALFGTRSLWQNNSIRTPPLRAYKPMYDHMATDLNSYQTATGDRVGDFKATLDWAVAAGAIVVELQHGYAAALTAAQCAAYDRALKANLARWVTAGKARAA